MTELRSPCAECDYRGKDKNKGQCRICIGTGIPRNYTIELGCLSESVPIDLQLMGYGGIEMPEYNPNNDDIEYQAMIQICSRNKVNIRNLQNGSVGIPFTRARMEIIDYFLRNSGKTQEEISKLVGISQARVSQLIRDLKEQQEIENGIYY